MTHREVYKLFKVRFPQYSEQVIEWFPNGKNSVRVRHANGRDYIFTYNSIDDWCFETAESFIKRLKGEK